MQRYPFNFTCAPPYPTIARRDSFSFRSLIDIQFGVIRAVFLLPRFGVAAGVEVDGAWVDGENPDGSPKGMRADFVQATATAKLGSGLLHGLISSLTGSVWSVLAGTLLLWRPTGTFSKRRAPAGEAN